MTIMEARDIFVDYYPNLPLAVKKAVKFTFENWDAMKNIPAASVPFEFTVDEALAFLKDLPKLPTDAREEDATFILRLNCAVAALQTDLSIWLRLEDLPHEDWRDVVGYEGHYQVSNYGRVKSFYGNQVLIRKLVRKPVVIKDGYIQVSLDKGGSRKCTGVHMVVAQTFIPNPENKPIVNHQNGNPGNNCVWNLNWVTNGENQQHAVEIGTKKIGYNNPRAKLTPDQVRYIRSHYIPKDKEFGLSAFSRRFGVGLSTLKRVVNGQGYRNVD
ncbi:MAG: HNH endonuclease [Selenomonadaceae bacterium]|nr:HNH endonuclease [Selenomonadaceae bacterium]MBR0289955.1 HNH endonuclease [Selenomonadaceae bacterium]